MDDTTLQTMTSKEILQVLCLSKDATAIYTTENITIQMANDAMIAYWGKDRSIIGKPIEEAIPELKGQPFIDILKNVWRTGETYEAQNTPAVLKINDRLGTYYFDFIYRAIKNAEGDTYCILHTATDVTDRVLSQRDIKETKERLIVLNDELTSSNEELNTVNRELNASLDELDSMRRATHMLRSIAEQSEFRFRSMFEQAPVGMCFLAGPTYITELANDTILKIWGRKREEVIGLPQIVARPELQGQPILTWLNNVYQTGQVQINAEIEVKLNENGKLRTAYVDSVYQPIKNTRGEVTGILAIVEDVTEKVLRRRQAERAQEMFNLAVESAELGTWHIDRETRNFTPSKRLKEIFGFHEDEEMTLEQAIMQVSEDYREQVMHSIEETIRNKSSYDVEYPITGRHGSLRWVRATGKLYRGDNNTPEYFSGTVIDITSRKELEQRKDDFISIASHELKTPITSLKASIQMLDRFKNNPGSPVVIKMIAQATRSMEKISSLIDGLLNAARMKDGVISIKKSVFSISELLKLCCSHVRNELHYNLVFNGDDRLEVYADEQRIDQVITNLVNNAVKYAPESKDIHFGVSRVKDMARITVSDKGQGIPADKLPHLFERYYQANTSGKHYSGIGLGLYICAEIVKAHGGEIGAESELGRGTTFWFTLPLAKSS